MGSHDAYLLKWDNYMTHIVREFYSLKSGNELIDVTLSCQGRRIGAHKMLLSACSPYFKDLFKENPCKHPIVIIQNVKFEDLEAILKFIYHGEVEIKDSCLISFLTTAELLEVKGLVDSDRLSDNSSKRNPGQSTASSDTLAKVSPSKAAETLLETKSLLPEQTSDTQQHESSQKRKPSKANIEPLDLENSCKRNLNFSSEKTSDSNLNCPSTSSEDSNPNESVGHKLIDSESIEIFKVVPDNCFDDSDDVVHKKMKCRQESETVTEEHSKSRAAREFFNSGLKVPNSMSSRNLGIRSYELELFHVKQEVDLVDEIGDVFSSASDSPNKESSSFEASTADPAIVANGFEDRFMCKICGNAYKHFNSLSSHMKKHKGQTVCPLCFKALSTRSKLRRHLILNHTVHPNDAANMIPLYSRGPASSKIPVHSYLSS